MIQFAFNDFTIIKFGKKMLGKKDTGHTTIIIQKKIILITLKKIKDGFLEIF